jgi:preprotein translocase subunit Sec61beta
VASEVELDPKRLVALGALVVAVLGAVGWWALA